jgi:hypothetical protein
VAVMHRGESTVAISEMSPIGKTGVKCGESLKSPVLRQLIFLNSAPMYTSIEQSERKHAKENNFRTRGALLRDGIHSPQWMDGVTTGTEQEDSTRNWEAVGEPKGSLTRSFVLVHGYLSNIRRRCSGWVVLLIGS